jgi:hypothetical protein
MKQIKTSNGFFVNVSDKDFEFLNQFSWYRFPNGYVCTNIQVARRKQKTVMIHRAITLVPENYVVDHKDGNPLNNQRENLRISTVAQNAQNRRKMSKPTSSKYKGVNWDKTRNKWRTAITHERKTIQIGRFETEIEAALAYNRKARELFGEFALVNKIGGYL